MEELAKASIWDYEKRIGHALKSPGRQANI